MRQFLLKFCQFALLAWIASSAIGLYLDRIVVRDRNNKTFWIRSLNRTKYDSAFLGSSRVEYMVDVPVVESIAGCRVVNLGCSGTGAADNYLTLVRFLQSNSVKTVVFQLDHKTVSGDFLHPFYEWNWLPDIYRRPFRSVVRQQYPWRFWFWAAMPAAKHIEYCKEYNYSGVEVQSRNYDANSGSQFKTNNFSIKEYPNASRHPNVNQKEIAYIDEIIHLCKTKNIHLLFYTAPFFEAYDRYVDPKMCQTWISNEARKWGISYEDFLELPLRSRKDLFYDINHLNRDGAREFSVELGKFLKQHQSSQP